jgi:hypothetical protein
VLTIGTVQRTIPVLRAPSFPYLEQTVAALGSDVHGLLGLSSLSDAFVLDGVLHVESTRAVISFDQWWLVDGARERSGASS